MRQRPRASFESLEDKRLLAVGRVIFDMDPGPLHSDAQFLGVADEEFIFTANVPVEGWQLLATDGTIKGLHVLEENPFIVPPPVITRTLTALTPHDIFIQTTYEDHEGRSYYHEMTETCWSEEWAGELGVPMTITGNRGNGLCYSSFELPWLSNDGVYGDHVLVTMNADGGPPMLASGHFSTWTQGSYFHLAPQFLRSVGDDTYAQADGWLIRLDESPLMESLASIPTRSSVTVMNASEVGNLTPEGFQVHATSDTLEFGATFTALRFAVDEFAIVESWDEVYETRTWYVTSAGLEPYANQVPAELLGASCADFGPYSRCGDYLYDGQQFIHFAYPEETAWLDTGEHGAFGCVIDTGFDHGREFTVTHLTPGDVNLDGIFDSADLVALMALGEYEDEIAGNSSFLQGDFDGDGDFTSSDLVEALALGWYT